MQVDAVRGHELRLAAAGAAALGAEDRTERRLAQRARGPRRRAGVPPASGRSRTWSCPPRRGRADRRDQHQSGLQGVLAKRGFRAHLGDAAAPRLDVRRAEAQLRGDFFDFAHTSHSRRRRSLRSAPVVSLGPRVDTLRDGAAEQPAMLARLLREGAACGGDCRAASRAKAALRAARGARLVGQRRPLRPVPAGHPERPGGGTRHPVGLHALRRAAQPRGGAGRRHQPVGPVAGHRGGPARGPPARGLHARAHERGCSPWPRRPKRSSRCSPARNARWRPPRPTPPRPWPWRC